jgi:hypothetical protein
MERGVTTSTWKLQRALAVRASRDCGSVYEPVEAVHLRVPATQFDVEQPAVRIPAIVLKRS